MLDLDEEMPGKYGRDDLEFQARVNNAGYNHVTYLDPSSREYRMRMQKLVREHFEYKNKVNQPLPPISTYEELLASGNYRTYTQEEVRELLKDHFEYKDSKTTPKKD